MTAECEGVVLTCLNARISCESVRYIIMTDLQLCTEHISLTPQFFFYMIRRQRTCTGLSYRDENVV